MSDCDFDPDWWKILRDASHQRRSETAAASSGTRQGDTFLIVTEGKVTEPVYFKLIVKSLGLSVVSVQVFPGDTPDAHRVIDTARSLANRQIDRHRAGQLGTNEPAQFDQVWAVIDTDVPVREEVWPAVVNHASKQAVFLAHSTPCIEYWLLLHLVDHPTTRGDLPHGAAAKTALKKALGRDYPVNEKEARDLFPIIAPHWPKAAKFAAHVRQHHLDAGTPDDPANPSTTVDRLVHALNDSARPHLRQL